MNGVKMALITVAVVAVAIGSFYIYRGYMQKSYLAQYAPIYNPSSMSQSSTNPATNDSNSQLDQDMNSVNTKLDSVNQEQINVDTGLNQSAPNLGQ